MVALVFVEDEDPELDVLAEVVPWLLVLAFVLVLAVVA
jgi:hypothetical protein